MKLVPIILFLLPNLAFALKNKPTYDSVIRARVNAEYAKFEDIEGALKGYFIVNSEKEGVQWAKNRHKYDQEAKEFKEWIRTKRYEYLLADNYIAVVHITAIDEMAGYQIRKQPIIFIKTVNDWQIAEVDIRNIYLFDLDGDNRQDVLYDNTCCGSEMIGAYLNRGEQEPLVVDAIFWRRMGGFLSDKIESNIKPCSGEKLRYWPSYEPMRKVYGACTKFRIDFKVHHCGLKAETFINFDCKKLNFFFGKKPFE